jgi:protein-disulfide isomerase
MHDALMAHKAALSDKDVFRYADEPELDLDRFMNDIYERRHAPRAERDLASADNSGAVSTPTFFISGRRYQGTNDLESLKGAVERELRQGVHAAHQCCAAGH